MSFSSFVNFVFHSGPSGRCGCFIGERTVIFPTRMNLKLLAEATSTEDAVTRARARELVTVEPKVAERNGERVLVLPPNAGYGAVEEPLSRVM